MFPTSSPIRRANVEIPSKYRSALPPTRPTFFRSCMPAMPDTTVQKITRVITMVMSRMNASPRGFIAAAVLGLRHPSTTATMIATRTWNQRLL